MKHNTAHYAGGQNMAAPAASTLPPLDAYQRAVKTMPKGVDITATALRRVVALRREGTAWATIHQGLYLSAQGVRRAYEALPEHLR